MIFSVFLILYKIFFTNIGKAARPNLIPFLYTLDYVSYWSGQILYDMDLT